MGLHKGKRVQDKGKVGVSEPKVVKLMHDKIDRENKYGKVMFPIGFKYNQDVQRLRRGDIIRFLDGSEHYVLGVTKLPYISAITKLLCWEIYGFSITRFIEICQDRLRVRKEDVRLMSDSECLVLFFEREEVRYE